MGGAGDGSLKLGLAWVVWQCDDVMLVVARLITREMISERWG